MDEGTHSVLHPEKRLTLERDSGFEGNFPNALHCVDIQIVSDTILVLKSGGRGADSLFFAAYSTKSFEYLGSFIHKGRSAGEMLDPHIAKTNTNYPFLAIIDNQTGKACLIDVPRSIEKLEPSSAFHFDLPENPADWCPLKDSTQLFLRIQDNRLLFTVSDLSRRVIKDFDLYKKWNARKYMTKLSSLITANMSNAGAAVLMICFPYLTLLSSDKPVRSCSTASDYKKWRRIIEAPFNPESVQYYMGVTSTADYIIALYYGCSIAQSMNPGHGCHLHIFDWAGNFLYDIETREDVTNIAFEPISKYLYCTSQFDDTIIRFDLSKVLPVNTY